MIRQNEKPFFFRLQTCAGEMSAHNMRKFVALFGAAPVSRVVSNKQEKKRKRREKAKIH
jgi:hypothetical protein